MPIAAEFDGLDEKPRPINEKDCSTKNNSSLDRVTMEPLSRAFLSIKEPIVLNIDRIMLNKKPPRPASLEDDSQQMDQQFASLTIKEKTLK